ncbi:MAG: peptide chain release factor N(5)-glutamine methyltransferase [Clostridiales bacterium]|nr:peptide chain release factor N(5)-glutamine methyltransferase [Clostridiales bacterium]
MADIPEAKTYRQQLEYAEEMLKPLSLKMENLEARELVAYASRMCEAIISAGELKGSRLDAFAPVSSSLILDDVLARRLSDEPLALIIGEWDFMSITIKTARGVLLPRADTECVAEYALSLLEDNGRILDLCCGTGCIGLSILHEKRDARCIFGDISEKALELTEKNVRSLGFSSRSEVRRIDALEDLCPEIEPESLDLIVCNPPYISSDEMLTLPVSVAAFEPHDALYGGVDGLSFYRCIPFTSIEALKRGGHIVFECGEGQAEEIIKYLTAAGYTDAGYKKDYNNKDRIIYGRRRNIT